MHIEPGFVSAAKIVLADGVVLAMVGACALALLRRPRDVVRTLIAAAFFTACMQSFHTKVGPSELHFIGAMPMYLALGLMPTLLGFALGLLAQGLLFEPADLLHLSVNTLSLALPLLAVHATLGRKVERVGIGTVLRLDGAYYAGVTAMVGFWLAIGEVATPFADWLRFAGSYVAVVALEPLLTIAIVGFLARRRAVPLVRLCFEDRRLA